MDFLLGLVAVSVSIIGWGSYFVPMKRIRQFDPFYFQLLMCVAIFGLSLIVSLVFRSFILSFFGIISGVLWALGNILSAQAVKYSGLSKSAPLWMGVGILTSFAWGLLFFMEPINILLLGVIGLLLLVLGIFLISSTGESRESAS